MLLLLPVGADDKRYPVRIGNKLLLDDLFEQPPVPGKTAFHLRHDGVELQGGDRVDPVHPPPQRASHEPQGVRGAIAPDLAVTELHAIDHGVNEAQLDSF